METAVLVYVPCAPFSLLFARKTAPTRDGDQTVGAETETQTSSDGIVSKVQPEHLPSLDGVRATAHLFQEYIPKRCDIRVVVIGRQVFAAEIHSQHSERSRIDFRQGYEDLIYAVHTLPDDIKAKALALVGLFQLQFSSMDFILTPEGEYVFLDLNPNGQFYWLQVRLLHHFPLKEAMADLLVSPEDYCL